MKKEIMTLKGKIKEHKYFFAFFMLFFVLITLSDTNSFLYKTSESCDAGAYYNVAKAMLQGKVPYKDIYDHKGIFLYFIYAFYNIIFPCKMYGVYITNVVCYLTAYFFSYKLFLTRYGKRMSACAPAMYILVALLFNDSFGCPEIYLVLLESVILYWQYADKTNDRKYLIFFGVMTGILLMSKFTLAIFPMIMFFWFLYDNINKKTEGKIIAKNVVIIIVSMLIPVAVSLLYLFRTDSVLDFLNVYFGANSKYASMDMKGVFVIAIIFIIFVLFNLKKGITMRERIFLAAISLQFVIIAMSKMFLYSFLPVAVVFEFFVFEYFSRKNISGLTAKIYKMIAYEVIIIFTLYMVFIGAKALYYNYTAEHAVAEANDIALLCVYSGIFIEQTRAPENKYFYTPNITYSENPQMWEALYGMVKEKIPDNIYVGYGGSEKIYLPEIHAKYSTEQVCNILDVLEENYTCTKEYANHLYKWERK